MSATTYKAGQRIIYKSGTVSDGFRGLSQVTTPTDLVTNARVTLRAGGGLINAGTPVGNLTETGVADTLSSTRWIFNCTVSESGGSKSVKLQGSNDDSSYSDVATVNFTATGEVVTTIAAGGFVYYRVVATLPAGGNSYNYDSYLATATTTINWLDNDLFKMTLFVNKTISFSNTIEGQSVKVALTNTTANYTVAWSGVTWLGNATPTQSTGATTDMYYFKKIDSVVFGWYKQGASVSSATSATTGTMSVTMGIVKVYTITPTGDCTFNAIGGTAGASCSFVITTSGASSRTLTFGTNFKSTGTLATGVTTAKVFTVSFVYDGTNWNEISRTTAM